MRRSCVKFDWGTKADGMCSVNVTPDSFSGDGVKNTKNGSLYIEAAVEQGIQMEKNGADILDVGGESTRPGSTPVSLDEELARVIPVIERLAKEVKIPLSIDTYKAEVARQAICVIRQIRGEQEEVIINDVWGGRMDPGLLTVVADMGATVVLMHNRRKEKNVVLDGELGGRYEGIEYKELIADIKRELGEQIEAALAAGIKKERIIIDPGFGYGKTVEQNIELLRRFDELKSLAYPMLAGLSRKSFLGYPLNLPVGERLEVTLAAVTLCIQKGADIVRVHDVREVRRAAMLQDAIIRP